MSNRVARYDERLTNGGKPSFDVTRVGLCASCRFMRQIVSDRGSVFYLCERSLTDPAYTKYPRLPIKACPGYEDATKPPVRG